MSAPELFVTTHCNRGAEGPLWPSLPSSVCVGPTRVELTLYHLLYFTLAPPRGSLLLPFPLSTRIRIRSYSLPLPYVQLADVEQERQAPRGHPGRPVAGLRRPRVRFLARLARVREGWRRGRRRGGRGRGEEEEEDDEEEAQAVPLRDPRGPRDPSDDLRQAGLDVASDLALLLLLLLVLLFLLFLLFLLLFLSHLLLFLLAILPFPQ